ncbi:nucleolar complex-associated protein 3 [Solanum dulcamara]|uniref:nucleolar complex-associated protein 3 n=1 Tax=Solanum dulcamara TaxID=45834 RepID=UPI0024866030|nr:nucleolar complex-associated protein 3 [Solanum dulcamara]XP_055834058.1 nucleolar complex-associated protein 3 [Solanum dulcamara]
MGKKKQKIVLPPELPPEIPDEAVEVSDEDVTFVTENREYTGFLSNLDTKSINKHVTRVADVKEDELESLYERRLKKKSLDKETEKQGLEVDPVDALPVKTLDGKLYYRTVPKATQKSENEDKEEANTNSKDAGIDASVVRLTKAEKRAKLKKTRKEAKKQAKEVAEVEDVEQIPQAEVLDEVINDMTAEEANAKKKFRLAELGTALLTDPELNIKSLKEMLEISKDGDRDIAVLALKSLLAVFRDIIPGYRIRLPTEKEQEMKVSKAVKKMRFYESTLLSTYKAYLQKLIAVEKQAVYKRVAVRCICTLLEAVPHFNFRENLLAAVIRNISSEDDISRKLCCATVKSLFTNEGKHGGEVTVEAVQMIADLVKVYDCQLHPDSIEVFMSLTFDDDLGKRETQDANNKFKSKNAKRKNLKELKESAANEKKRTRKEMMSKTREEVTTELKAASLATDVTERRRMQTDVLSAIFETYFRVLKHAIKPRSEAGSSSQPAGSHPLLTPCLNGIGKFCQLIDLDFMSDLMNYLRKLARSGNNSDGSSKDVSACLTVSERLQCCIVAFRVMRNNLDALNVDLQDFFVQFYNLIIEYRPGRDKGEILAEALKIMLCDDRQHDMQRAAAFIKRLATFSLCSGSAESLAALVTLKHLLQKNVKCRNLLENDAGGGSVSGAIAKYQPYATDPNLSGALASVLWELNLLSKHFHPAVSTMASNISMLGTGDNQVHLSNKSPQQAFKELSLEQDSFIVKVDLNAKRKKGNASLKHICMGADLDSTIQVDENDVKKKLSEHYSLLHDIAENERLRGELVGTTLSLNLYEQYKKQKKRRTK